MIDLGEVPRSPVVVLADPLPFPVRGLLAALSALLVALLAGAVAHVPPAPPAIVPARLGGSSFVDGDRLYVISSGRALSGYDVQNRVVSTYSLPGARLLSRTTVAVSGGVTAVWEGDGILLVTYQLVRQNDWALVAMEAGTDRALWRRSGTFVAASAADRLVLLQTTAAELGVDLTTGRVRWQVPHQREDYTAAVGEAGEFPRTLVTVTDDGRVTTRDPRTGRAVATADVPRQPGRLVSPVGDVIMVDVGGAGSDAYRLPGLQRLWRSTADLSQSWTQADCGAMICTFRQQRGVTALDRATGREMWSSDRWSYVTPAGRYLLATAADDAAPALWVLDPADGHPRGDLGGWTELGRDDTGRIFVQREPAEGYRLHYGVLDVEAVQVRILGAADGVSGGCEVAVAVLVCRMVDASIGVWSLG